MKNKILLVASLFFGLMFINAGLNKFFNYMPAPRDLPQGLVTVMTAFMQIGWLMPLVAVVEITGGLLFLTRRFRMLGAIIIFPVLIGILLTNIIYAPAGLPLVLILFAIDSWVLVANREKYLPLIKGTGN
jgi:uncharacterized membrane protein YphA (DoxX/SURF4 family)